MRESEFTYEPFLLENQSEPVWRYIAFYKLLWAIKEKKMWLTLLKNFDDSFETSVPRQTKYGDRAAMGYPRAMKPIWAHWPEMASVGQSDIARIRKGLMRVAHASCWRWGDESEAMWRLYCGGTDGVAIRSTFSKLKDSIHDPHAMVSRVEYIDYKNGGFKRHEHDYDPALHKRKAFEHEQEVRVLRAKRQDFIRASEDESFSCGEHVEIAWDPEAVIEEIVVSPLNPKVYVDVFKDAIERLSPSLAALVHLSELAEDPEY